MDRTRFFYFPAVYLSRFFATFVLALASLALIHTLVAEPSVHVRESRLFSVVGEDNRSVGFVRDMAAQFEVRAERWFDFPATVRQPIVLRLMPPRATSGEDYTQALVVVNQQGLVSGSLLWDANTSFESVCRLIAQSYLTRLAFYTGGQPAVERLPIWLIIALEHDLLAALRPAISSVWAQQSLVAEGLRMDQLLEAGWDVLKGAQQQDAFWFLRSLLERLPTRVERVSFFKRLLSADWELAEWLPLVDPFLPALMSENAVLDFTPDMPAADKLNFWWDWARSNQVARNRSFYETPGESRELVQGLIQLDIPVLELEARAGFRQLWRRRDEAAIREVIEARITLLASRMERMNPLYFNAAHSLASLYQVLLRERSRSPEYLSALADFLTDFEDARVLERDVAEIFLQALR